MKPKSIFFSPNSLKAPLGEDLINILQNVREISFLLKESLVENLSEVACCQGVVGLFHVDRVTALPPDCTLAIACDKISDPGNLGTLVRTAFGLGLHALISIDTTDPWSPKTIRSSMGTVIQLPIVETSWIDMRATVLNRNLKIYLAVLDESAVPYYDVDYTIPCVIVIGSEAGGVSAEALNLPNAQKVYIPMGDRLEFSLNAGVAGGIIMAEAAKQRRLDK